MRENGYIQFKEVCADPMDFDEKGVPIVGKTTWGEPKSCFVRKNTDNRKGRYDDGVFRQITLTITLEYSKVDSSLLDTTQVLVTSKAHGIRKRPFDIINVTAYPEFGRITIEV